jgi:pilus assembly protein Flp/PilA
MTTGIKRLFQRLLADRAGATAIEYGLIVALLGMVIVGGVSALGNHLYTILSNVSTAISH